MYTIHLVRLLADSGIDYGVQRAIVVTRFAVLDFHRARSGARQQSDEVDSVHRPTRPIASVDFLDATYWLIQVLVR
jgi:hypothetical protein